MRAEVLAAIYLASAPMAVAQEATSGAAAPTQTVAAGPQYHASSFHRLVFGDGYRELWTTPIQVPLLDLERDSGGLVPKKRGGGKETRTLHLKGQDGREWRFRSVDKDPREVLPKGLRFGFAENIVGDQISAGFPVGPLVVDPLTDAAGILHVSHRLVIMPDDPRLGEFRKDFAGILGMIEENPRTKAPVTPGFEGYGDVVDTEELQKRMDADAGERLDERAFLRARLFDAVIGDYDRHADQWQFVKNLKTGLWEPLPKDRDQAFVHFDGLTPAVARMGIPHLTKFTESYPRPIAMMWQARFLDRRHLSDLDWTAWEEAVSDLQARLTGAVIDQAVARMPAPYYARAGATLSRRLKRRVERLPDFAWSFYLMISHEAEVQGTDEADSVTLSHLRDGKVQVAVAGPEGTYFDRTFDPSQTREVRIFTKGGNDRVISEGERRPGLRVRVVAGDGDDFLDDSAGGHTRFYDSSGDNKVVKGPGTYYDRRPYTQVMDGEDPALDWGSGTRVLPYLHGDKAYGVLLGFTLQRQHYGFRKHPWANQHSLRLAYATSLQTGDVRYEYQSRRADNHERFGMVAAGATGLDLINYYGFGNETRGDAPQEFNDVRQWQYMLSPSYRLDVTGIDVTVGPVLKYSTTSLSHGNLIAVERPYGSANFGQAGARLGFGVDHFDRLLEKPAGVVFRTEGNYYAPVWSTTEQFGEVHGTFAAYARAPIPLKPTLAVRIGGRQTFGRYSINEAAFIGGRDSIRGLPPQRYAGDASAYGGAELRFQLLGKDHGFLSRFGVFGLADGGRVFLKGETSDRWHTAVGGGLWLAFFQPKNCLSVSMARSEGDTRLYLDVGRVF